MSTSGMKRVQVKASQLFCATLAALFLSGPVLAAEYTWEGGGPTGSWATNANWNASPTFNASADIIFNTSGAGNLETYLNVARTVRSITFNGNATSAVSITLANTNNGVTACNLTLGSTTVAPWITVDAGSSAAHTIGVEGGSVKATADRPNF